MASKALLPAKTPPRQTACSLRSRSGASGSLWDAGLQTRIARITRVTRNTRITRINSDRAEDRISQIVRITRIGCRYLHGGVDGLQSIREANSEAKSAARISW
jgi:hypothetical protein